MLGRILVETKRRIGGADSFYSGDSRPEPKRAQPVKEPVYGADPLPISGQIHFVTRAYGWRHRLPQCPLYSVPLFGDTE